MCANFQEKQTTLTFLLQIYPKRKLGFEIQETNIGRRISILEMPRISIFKENGQLWVLAQKMQNWVQIFLKNAFWSQKLKNLSLDLESTSLRYFKLQFSDKTDNFDFSGSNLFKNGFWRQNFKSLILETKLPPPKYHMCQFSLKMNNF